MLHGWNWMKVLIFLKLQTITKDGGYDKLTRSCWWIPWVFWGTYIFNGDLGSKLICCGVDDIVIFQGLKSNVTLQIMTMEHPPFFTCIHYMAHRCKLIMQTLFNLLLVAKIDNFLQSIYMHFFRFPKSHLNHNQVAKIMETKGLKILVFVMLKCNGYPCLIALSKCVLFEYKSPAYMKMIEDITKNVY